MNRRIIAGIALAALVIAAIATSGFGLLKGDDGPLTLYGNVDIREVEMAFQASGRVSEVPVEEGERVKQGELLAVLDPEAPVVPGAVVRVRMRGEKVHLFDAGVGLCELS